MARCVFGAVVLVADLWWAVPAQVAAAPAWEARANALPAPVEQISADPFVGWVEPETQWLEDRLRQVTIEAVTLYQTDAALATAYHDFAMEVSNRQLDTAARQLLTGGGGPTNVCNTHEAEWPTFGGSPSTFRDGASCVGTVQDLRMAVASAYDAAYEYGQWMKVY